MAKILIIDDDNSICKLFSKIIIQMEHAVMSALTLEEGLKLCQSNRFDVVFLDVVLPDGDGLAMIPEINRGPFSPEIIIITGAGSSDDAEIAIKHGAWDYIEKPVSPPQLKIILNRALQYRNAKTNHPENAAASEMKFDGPEGASPCINETIKAIHYASTSDVNVLLTGETGTGKGFFADAIHCNSLRRDHNFVVVDCTSIPATLVESILFGSEKGAFTDSKQSKPGLIKQADGGTLFLDEVSELPFDMQKSFLHVLDSHRFRPVGGSREVASDFRLIAATNRNLHEMISNGLFRNDLFYRLHSLAITLPPLRERAEDLEALVRYHSVKVCARWKIKTKAFSADFFEALGRYDWPGNIRELFNTIETIIVKTPGEPVLFPRHLPEKIRIRVAKTSVGMDKEKPQKEIKEEPAAIAEKLPTFNALRETTLSKVEEKYLVQLMAASEGDIAKACRLSELSRSTLYSLLKKYNISRIGWQPRLDFS
jgi:two-component system, NtrC family, response regulator